MNKLATFFFTTVTIIHISYSQSEFLQRGRSGFGGGIGMALNSEMSGINFFAGYSYKGYLNAEISYSKANGGKVTEGVIAPLVTYYLIKQEDARKAPTLGISLGYSGFTSRTTEVVSVPVQGSTTEGKDTTLVTERKVDAVLAMVTAHHRIGYWKMFFFQPLLSGGAVIQSQSWEFTLRGGVAIGTRIQNGPLILFTPALEIRSGLSTFVMTLGVVF